LYFTHCSKKMEHHSRYWNVVVELGMSGILRR
jgi:hypothetical protein